MQLQSSNTTATRLFRVRVLYAALIVICALFIIRLFYLQIIRHDYYRTQASSSQLKEYEVEAERGVIEAYDGNKIVPVVLNETKYTLFADPVYVQDPKEAAEKVQAIIGGSTEEIEQKMRTQTRYAVLAKKLDKEQKEQIDSLEIKGIGTREQSYRTYPQGTLAAQVLGFVNDEAEGKYGVEQYLDDQLKGQPGQLKAITDAKGVPLVSNKDNIIMQPRSGERVVLTLDISMQRQLEDILKAGLERAKSSSGSALILDANTGAVKAMANYPTYNPAEFFTVEDANLFNNANVSAPLEVGSIMKPLTAAAALDLGAVQPNTTYYDPSFFRIDDATVSNIEEDGGAATRSVADILEFSLNTGATWLLMQMGGGQINEQARTRWHDYMTNHYRFGQPTGIEQGYEAEGFVPDPTEGYGLNIQYANTAFGQGMSATTLQMGGALLSVVNGGTYYRPYLVDRFIDTQGNERKQGPHIVGSNVVKPEVGQTIKQFMEGVIQRNYIVYGMRQLRPEYSIGGKTGTAEITKPEGGYYDDRFNGTFMGFVGGDKPQYIIVVRVNEPGIGGYAGSRAAAPIFVDLTNMLIDNFNVLPKS